MLTCRENNIFSFNTQESAASGLIIAMDIRPYKTVQATQTVLALRNSATNQSTFSVEITSGGKVKIWHETQDIVLAMSTNTVTWGILL